MWLKQSWHDHPCPVCDKASHPECSAFMVTVCLGKDFFFLSKNLSRRGPEEGNTRKSLLFFFSVLTWRWNFKQQSPWLHRMDGIKREEWVCWGDGQILTELLSLLNTQLRYGKDVGHQRNSSGVWDEAQSSMCLSWIKLIKSGNQAIHLKQLKTSTPCSIPQIFHHTLMLWGNEEGKDAQLNEHPH